MKKANKPVLFQWKNFRKSFLSLTTAVFAFNFINPGFASEASLRTGLKEFTESERQNLQKRKVRNVHPNRIFLERKNKELREKGRPEIDPRKAKPIEEAIEVEDLNSATIDTSTSTSNLATPANVDNSKLPSFPPIISQGSEGSCVGFATTYFQMSHEYCLVRGCSNSAGSSTIFSPRWTYNLINFGTDGGSYFSDAYNVITTQGAAPLSSMPYQAGQFLPWSIDGNVWRSAISNRMNPVSYISAVDTQTGLDQMKATLANGHVIVFGTYINSWVYTTVKADPSLASNPFAGQHAVSYQNGSNGGHAMTIVGYDDSVWIDINANNIVDSGEKGALKIANSWGSTWRNGGYIWMAYDALKTVSSVSGAPVSSTRISAFQGRSAYLMTAKAQYTPKLLAKVRLNTLNRQHLSLSLGVSNTTYSTPTTTRNILALRNQGGLYAFNGSATTAVDGTFYFDASDLVPATNESMHYYLTVRDSTSGNPVTLLEYRLEDPANSVITENTTSGLLPISSDANSATRYIAYAPGNTNQAPVARISGTSTGTNPITVNFDGSSSTDADGSVVSYAWNMGDGSAVKYGAIVQHSYSKVGTFQATLTVTDDKGATGIANYTVTVADTIAPTAPSNLRASVVYKKSGRLYRTNVTLNWTAATDNSGSVVYLIYRNGVLLATTTSLSYSDLAIKSSSTYTVQARDNAGNASAMSNAVTANPR